MKASLTCSIPSQTYTYEIEVADGLLTNPNLIAQLSKLATRFAIITDETVQSLHAEPFRAFLSSHGLEVDLFAFPSGEEHKTRQTKEQLEDQLLTRGLGRDTCVIAIGGGVVTDVGGYLAATYCRGVPLVMIPTTLLAMVDASIGGKVGVNVPQGKNLIGSIYQPKRVLIDPLSLKTLPLSELKNGIVEMLKHGLIADASYFDFLDKHASDILEKKPSVLIQAILGSCRIKQMIVEQDEKEQGMRRLLNFGHTVGHALETLSNYTLAHGEAVAIGILVESALSVKHGYLKSSTYDRIQSVFGCYGISQKMPEGISIEALVDAMVLDKKSLKRQPRFVQLADIGIPLAFEGAYCTIIDEAILREVLEMTILQPKALFGKN